MKDEKRKLPTYEEAGLAGQGHTYAEQQAAGQGKTYAELRDEAEEEGGDDDGRD